MGATSATATQEVIASADCPRAVVGVAPCRLTSKSSRRAHRSCHDVAEARGSFGALDGRIPVRLRNVEEATKFRKTAAAAHRRAKRSGRGSFFTQSQIASSGPLGPVFGPPGFPEFCRFFNIPKPHGYT